MKVHTKHRRVTEYLHTENNVPNDINWRLTNVYEDQTVDVDIDGG